MNKYKKEISGHNFSQWQSQLEVCTGPGRQMRVDFSNRLDRQMRDDFSNGPGQQMRDDFSNGPGQASTCGVIFSNGPGRHMRGDFWNRLGWASKKRNEFFKVQVWLQIKENE